MFSLARQPAITRAEVRGLIRTRMRNEIRQATDRVRTEAARLSPGGPGGTIGDAWRVRPLPGTGGFGFAAVNPHPGARPLNDGASWPGKMPPWGPGTPLADWAFRHGIPPFVAARAIQRWGLAPRLFAEAALDNLRPELQAQFRHGLEAWVEVLAGGSHG